jgi:hypothetical protein
VTVVISQMCNSSQKFVCPSVDSAVRYTTRYTVNLHEDNEQYLVLQDYTWHLAPTDLSVDMGNLYRGNEELGKLTVM